MLTFAELCCDDSHRRRNVGAVIHSKFNKINSIFAFISILLLQPSEQLTGCFDIICCATGYTTEWRGDRSSNSYSSHSRAKNKIVFHSNAKSALDVCENCGNVAFVDLVWGLDGRCGSNAKLPIYELARNGIRWMRNQTMHFYALIHSLTHSSAHTK